MKQYQFEDKPKAGSNLLGLAIVIVLFLIMNCYFIVSMFS